MKLRKKLNAFGCICFLVGFCLALLGYISGRSILGIMLLIFGAGMILISIPLAVIAGIADYKRHKIKNSKKRSPYRPTAFVPKREMTIITEIEGYEKPADKAETEVKDDKVPLKNVEYQTYDVYRKGERKRHHRNKKQRKL